MNAVAQETWNLNDHQLGIETEARIQQAAEFAEQELEHYRKLNNGKYADTEQLLQMLTRLHIKHNGNLEKIEKDAKYALNNIYKEAEIEWTAEEAKIRANARAKNLERDIKNIKERYAQDIRHMRLNLASEEEILKRQAQFEKDLAEKTAEHAAAVEKKRLADREKLLEDSDKRRKKIQAEQGVIDDKYPHLKAIHESGPSKEDGGAIGKHITVGKAFITEAGKGFSSLFKGEFKEFSNSVDKLRSFGSDLRKSAESAQKLAENSKKLAEQLEDEYTTRLSEGEDPDSPEMQALRAQWKQAEKQADLDRAQAKQMKDVADKIEKLQGDYQRNFNLALSNLDEYQGKIDARLQGSDKSYRELSDRISSNLMLSPFVKTTKVLDKLKEASEKGINYNIEQRAFLASLTDKIATTFDAFDSNLMRIIRLQQADSTASRLGMEASLTKLFNNMFEDSSYLSETADQVSSALVDAQSQLTHEGAAEFEYTVQKWLGALSSLGMSGDTLTQIATGLNYLATGDVTNLASNSSLQTLFAMAASRSENLEYSEILLEGLDATKTNELLGNMVVYLKEIADNSENQVVKSAYGDILNLSHSDMRALSNLTVDEINTLGGTNLTYSQMGKELNNQFSQLITRTSLPTMLSNVYENTMYSMASDMANNPVTFAMTKMLNWMEETGTDINIPFINAAGFGLDLNASVKDLMQMGLGIGQAFSLTTNILSGLGSVGGLNLNSWNASETTKRGSGLNLTSLSTLGGTSGSIGTYAVSNNSSDAATSSISSAVDDSEDTKKITNKNSKPPEKTLDDLFKAIIGESAESFVSAKDPILKATYDPTFEAINVRLKGLELLDGTIPVFDAALKTELTNQMTALRSLMTTNITVGVQQVKLVDGTILQIPKETISAAIKEVLFANEDKNFNNLVDTIENGTLKVDQVTQAVAVKNNVGDKLQVSNLVW